MLDDDWNSDFHMKLFSVRVCTRSGWKMIWNGKSPFHHHLPWINFNQFGWVHSNVKANIETFSDWRWFERAQKAPTIWYIPMLREGANESRNQLWGTRQILRFGIFDFVVFHLRRRKIERFFLIALPEKSSFVYLSRNLMVRAARLKVEKIFISIRNCNDRKIVKWSKNPKIAVLHYIPLGFENHFPPFPLLVP